MSLSEPQTNVFLITLNSPPDNRLTPELCTTLVQLLDQVEKEAEKRGEPCALVTTAKGKIFSNGLALEQVLDRMQDFMENYYHVLLWRWLCTPLVTVAALNGHAFAGGMMFALAHDYRVMRKDRGYLCMNEVDIPAPLTPGMSALLRVKIGNPAVLRDCLLQAHRFSAPEALSLRLVDEIAEEAQVLQQALNLASQWRPKGGRAYSWLKEETAREAVDYLRKGGIGFAKL